jgi:hypothetical protein
VTPGFRAFEFDLPGALLISLIDTFDSMEGAPLVPDNVASLPDEQGVYQLLHEGRVVYVGKTDAEAGLRRRLGRHAFTIQHRSNLDASAICFKAIRVFVFTAIDLETQLIRHYGRKSRLAWNNSGFGSNDPGRERDTTKLSPNGFDALFPVDLDRILNMSLDAPLSVAQALDRLRQIVPYKIRAQSDPQLERKTHPDFDAEITQLPDALTARSLLRAAAASLPPGWQVTLLPGRVILYQEDRPYSAGSIVAKS